MFLWLCVLVAVVIKLNFPAWVCILLFMGYFWHLFMQYGGK